MGRTIPSFRQKIDQEIASWRRFRDGLLTEDKKIFDELLLKAKKTASAAGLMCRPLPFQPFIMSIIFDLYKEVRALKNE